MASTVRGFLLSSSRLALKPSRAFKPSKPLAFRPLGLKPLGVRGLTVRCANGGDAVVRVLVAVADGTEEIEAVTTIDTLVRAGKMDPSDMQIHSCFVCPLYYICV
jgi:hypothetical protein